LCQTEIEEIILARGHRNILATHRTTLEITKDHNLSKRGDCIVAVSADKAINDMSPEFKENLRRNQAKILIIIKAGEAVDTVIASGSSKLILSHPLNIVIRISDYICSRTLAIEADKAACNLSRRLVEKLKDPKQQVKIKLRVS
jgi:hypothetical protein